MKLSKGIRAIIVILLVLLADQTLKFWVKTHLMLYEDIHITDWFLIRFVENDGIAMGIEVAEKFFVTIFRMAAAVAIIYYLYFLIKKGYKLGYILCVSLIFAGAAGNIIDCIFYGVIFNDSPVYNENLPHQAAVLFPAEGGYNSWFHGRVVDMFYFPLFEFNWPSWMPFIGGQEFMFFRYIFNVADAAISVGIIVLLLFYRKTFSVSLEKKKVEN
ncbi:MAG: lipoprotein signal peptidase [Dysgonamonadaceae bacterium]|jgi:signal peptidase II|nr:lipoprotein signal peptidase [Dysgonamonadaceae bacterium]